MGNYNKKHNLQQGQRFQDWLIVNNLTTSIRGETHNWCRCLRCGLEKWVNAGSLVHGRSMCCHKCSTVTHGENRNNKPTPTHQSWSDMIKRCTNKKSKFYKNYGGRGIKVCERWKTFENFKADMGERPSKKHTLNRINNDGNYEPGNCNWATKREQSINRRNVKLITLNNKTLCLTEWAEIKASEWKISDYHRIYAMFTGRIRMGWNIEKTINTPPRDLK